MVKHIYSKETEHSEIEHYDVLILGAGPAGLTAALYSARYTMKTAVIAKSFGGTANLAGEIENWPGFVGSGTELMRRFKEQAEKAGARFLESEVTDVSKDENGFILELNDKVVHGKTIIIASGTEHRKLNIPGEKEFVGKGVSYCAVCDGMFFKNKTVVIIGGADSAAKSALYLSELAKKVYVIYRRDKLRCEPVSFRKLSGRKNVEIIYNTNPIQIIGDKKVRSIKSIQQKKEISMDVDGIFIEVGATPAVDIVKDLGIEVDCEGYLITDKEAKTNIEGCFAAGDNTNSALKQVVTASAEGAIAAKSAYDFIQSQA